MGISFSAGILFSDLLRLISVLAILKKEQEFSKLVNIQKTKISALAGHWVRLSGEWIA
jgi:hypothetical protein